MPNITFSQLGNGRFQLKTEQKLPARPSAAFHFFADAANLEALTPPWLNFRITTPLPIQMQKGTVIDYQLRLRFVPLRWRTLISEWVENERFVDEALKSPYKRWHHLHEFEPCEDGTLMRDTVTYEVPFGSLVERLFVRSQLRQIFDYRYRQLERTFKSTATTLQDESSIA